METGCSHSPSMGKESISLEIDQKETFLCPLEETKALKFERKSLLHYTWILLARTEDLFVVSLLVRFMCS